MDKKRCIYSTCDYRIRKVSKLKDKLKYINEIMEIAISENFKISKIIFDYEYKDIIINIIYITNNYTYVTQIIDDYIVLVYKVENEI